LPFERPALPRPETLTRRSFTDRPEAAGSLACGAWLGSGAGAGVEGRGVGAGACGANGRAATATGASATAMPERAAGAPPGPLAAMEIRGEGS
jgi:hypothetical protein